MYHRPIYTVKEVMLEPANSALGAKVTQKRRKGKQIFFFFLRMMLKVVLRSEQGLLSVISQILLAAFHLTHFPVKDS